MAYIRDESIAESVELMSSCGVTQENIAKIVNISVKTLCKYYADELSLARDRATTKIAKTLLAKAIDGDNACMFFWLKTRAGWKETAEKEVPVPVMHISDKTSPEKAAEVYKAFMKSNGN